MRPSDFLNYIKNNVILDDETAETLINNIVGYVVGQGLVDEDEIHSMLSCLLDGIGIDEEVIYKTDFIGSWN